jgi:hypothetical protein
MLRAQALPFTQINAASADSLDMRFTSVVARFYHISCRSNAFVGWAYQTVLHRRQEGSDFPLVDM